MKMDKLIHVMIADDNMEFCTLLKEYLDKTGDIYVIGVAKDGIEAVKMIRELKPDVVILDIIMPNLDGIGVLEKIPELKLVEKPAFIALTAIGKDIFVQKALELGADYYLMKPFEVNVLATRIRQINSERAEKRRNLINAGKNTDLVQEQGNIMERTIAELIKMIGITPNIAGYRYLREAVILSINQPEVLHTVSKSIYPILAGKYNTTPRNIDRAIRCAIDSAGKKTKITNNDSRLGFIVVNDRIKPNNAQIISYLVDKTMQRMRSI